MNLVVHQNIIIYNLRVDGVSQASVLQIGSAGKITTQSQAYTFEGYVPGRFPELAPPDHVPPLATLPLVPLPSVSR